MIRKKLGLNQSVMAKELGLESPVAISKYEKDQRQPDVSKLIIISKLANASLDWLLTGEGPKEKTAVTPIISPNLSIISPEEYHERISEFHDLDDFVPVRLLADEAAAGDPMCINDNDIEGFVIIYRKWCKTPLTTTCVRVKGRSMHPILRDGSIIGINHLKTDPEDLRGKIVAARDDGGVTIKTLMMDTKCFILHPANSEFDNIIIRKEEGNPIIGKVEWFWGKLD
jgi:phage repressor protein C with HTH and peptisase S24 domain